MNNSGMQYRRVGKSGLEVSAISIGGWLTFGGSIEERTTSNILAMAIEAGVNFVDLADAYARGAAEEAAGRALAHVPRHELVISSKCFWPQSDAPNDHGLSRKHILESCDRSLGRLGMDYLDLFFCHREDPDVPLEETIRAMDHLVNQGKVLYWGTSCWSVDSLERAHALCREHGWHGPIVEQPEYNLLNREIEGGVQSAVRESGMGLVCWSPLAGGLLTGKYDQGVPAGTRGADTNWLKKQLTDQGRERLCAFSELASAAQLKPSQLALAWILHQDSVAAVITGATRVEQLQENLGALGVSLELETLTALEELFPPVGV
jgi:voltage-dependent potassium channel beta subunit